MPSRSTRAPGDGGACDRCPPHAAGATSIGRLVVSVGGEGPTGTYSQVEALDTRTGWWRSLTSTPAPRHGLGLVTVGGRLIQ